MRNYDNNEFWKKDFPIMVIVLILSILFLALAMNVTAEEDPEQLSITTEDDWYRKGEVMIYNVSAPAGTKIHVVLEPPDGGVYREVFAHTDKNGTYEDAFYSSGLWPGAWKIRVYDYNNNTAYVKIMIEMNSEDIYDTVTMLVRWGREFQEFLWQLVAAIAIISMVVIIASEYRIGNRVAEFTGQKTWSDTMKMAVADFFKYPYEDVNYSKKGHKDAHMVTRKRFNELRWKVIDNEHEINWCRAEALNFDSIHPDVGPKMKKMLLNRLRRRIEYLLLENSILEPQMEKEKDNLKKSLIRQGLWTQNMSMEERDAVLYPGEEKTLVRDINELTDDEIQIELEKIKNMRGVKLGKKERGKGRAAKET